MVVNKSGWATEKDIWHECQSENQCTLYMTFSYETGDFMINHAGMYY